MSGLRLFLLLLLLSTESVFSSALSAKQQTRVSRRLEGTEEKLRNRESRPEDLHVIAELREMVSEREALVKKLVVSREPERAGAHGVPTASAPDDQGPSVPG